MKYSILPVLLIAASAISYGQDTTKLKRTPYKLTIVVDKETDYLEDLKSGLYVFPDNTAQLYPGETIYIEVKQEKGSIKSMNAVKENTNPNKTLIIAFSQTVSKGAHESMMLKVTNPFSQNLIYKAKIYILQQKKWVDTDVYPVEAGLVGFEIWPDIITSIGLGQWKFQSK